MPTPDEDALCRILKCTVRQLRAWEAFDVMQNRAGNAVNRAVADGRLPKISTQRCVDCRKPAAVYEHRSYAKSRRLHVVPVCRRCNKRRGRAVLSGGLAKDGRL